ncbi:hypothetical protein BDZ97DRAFT_1667996 [Flammula alnicola]|nr:hypothetical protein BDZ97DRAFT_1667996 [Flammula alnicola]
MIEHLSTLVNNFPGAANQTRCFTHILNLIAKSILRQFEVRKKAQDGDSDDLDDATKVLAALVQELELGSPEADDDSREDDGDGDGEMDADDDDERLGDERDGMSEEEVTELEESLVPIRLMLTKLRTLTNAIKNSSTIVLSQWLAKLEDLGLNVRMMPRDVSTCWNSTFDMLDFAINYCVAINALTSNRDLNLRKYELEDNEWAVAVNLRDTLKACNVS